MEVAHGGRFTATNTTVRALIRFAYRVPDVQISGGPSWVNTTSYDVVATPGTNGNADHVQKMVQHLLVERFKLAFTRETKNLKAYVMVEAKNGSKLRVSTTAEPSVTGGRGQASATRLIARGVSIQQFASSLSALLAYPVLDKTGLTGTYDFELEFTPFQTPPTIHGDDSPPPDLSGTSIFTALQDQLGLKLEARREPVETFAIQHAEKATEN